MTNLKKLLNIKFFYVVYKMIRRYFDDAVSKSAAALSYFMLFSLFPLTLFLHYVLSRIEIPDGIYEFFERIIPQDVIELLVSYIEYNSSLENSHFFAFGIVFTIYFFSRAINSLLRTISQIYDIGNKKRSGIIRVSISVICTIGFMLSFILIIILIILGDVLVQFLVKAIPFIYNLIPLFNLIRFLIPVVIVVLFLLLLYYIIPNKKVTVKDCIPGTIFAACSWTITSILFSFYVNNLSNYSLLYGSISTIMIMMLWLYVTGIVIIMGAELNYILQEY